jgi:glycosyltransferase involved in cell wall biosynthesis
MNVARIANAIVTLAKSPELRRKMGEIGKKRVADHYTKDGWLIEYSKMYDHFAAVGTTAVTTAKKKK